MVAAAIKSIYKKDSFKLMSVLYHNPLTLDADENKKLRLIIQENDNRSFNIASYVNSQQDWVTHATGNIELNLILEHNAEKLSEIRERCLEAIHRDDFYRTMIEKGYDFGP